jgi:putative DNA primase/helicase
MAQFGFIGTLTGQESVIWKTEGATDLAAILSLDLPEGHTAICNACGAGETPDHRWIESMAHCPEIFVIHDCDKPGQVGATWVTNEGTGRRRAGWAPAIAALAPGQVRNVVLPFPLEDSHGKDVRDWIIERLDAGKSKADIYAELLELARGQAVIEKLAEAAIESIESEPGESEDVSQEEGTPAEPLEPVWEGEDDPHRLAKMNLDKYQNAHGGHLVFWRDEWWKYREGRYRKISDSNLRAKVTAAIRTEFEERWRENEERRIAKEKSTGEEQKRHPVQKVTTTLTRNVIEAMRSLTAMSDSIEIPSWIPTRRPRNLVSMQNGLLDLDAIFRNQPAEECLLEHSKDWFSAVQLPYAFDWQAKCDRWLEFLNDVFNGDQESITALQMWFGYLLTQDTSQQKMMMVIGEPRSGKGTIMRTLDAMLGPGAVANPSLSQLASPFELHGLVGKSVGIIGDARLSHRTDEVAVTERLLSITGQDPQDVQRKHMPTLHAVKLAIRFMLFSNELPALHDSSAALMTRCILLVMPNSYVGREDHSLGPRLIEELPGILIWSIIGRRMLDDAGRISQPESGRDLLKQFRSMVSPVSLFVEEGCVRGGEIETKELFDYWCEWCKENDLAEKIAIHHFARKLKAVVPGIRTERKSSNGFRARKFIGISVKKNNFEEISEHEQQEAF